jgi:hypothetical protein
MVAIMGPLIRAAPWSSATLASAISAARYAPATNICRGALVQLAPMASQDCRPSDGENPPHTDTLSAA